MDIERDVAKHYTHGALERAILDALAASGKDIDRLVPDDLSGIDEFHLGWRVATMDLARELRLAQGMHILDVGSGIGGPARYFSQAHGCRVTGIDLTQEYVDVANALTRRCGLGDRVTFRQASALALPFADGTFDGVTLIHVGMNIEDKATLFGEVRRVSRPGSRFAVYDVVRAGDGDIPYPMPWAATAGTSFVEPPRVYRELLAAAGFEIESERDRREPVIRLGREMRENAARHGAPPLGLHILMGPAAAQRLGNVMRTLECGTIAPVAFIARAV
ncbi:MAG TPA: methyltransferase domain-containing protein [Arenibaculum sp.]|nr:methyltransferase domain-containing protein [Arenibaculum sp.]